MRRADCLELIMEMARVFLYILCIHGKRKGRRKRKKADVDQKIKERFNYVKHQNLTMQQKKRKNKKKREANHISVIRDLFFFYKEKST